MSYLNCPRIHFGGVFYCNPSNLNNVAENYNPDNELNYNTGLYRYPDGVAQLWLQDCQVLSVVGSDGFLCTNSSEDVLIGAVVEAASPETPQPTPDGGIFDMAKIVDLMQFRSEVYGLRLYVNIAGGGGFSGLVLTPQLRDIYFLRGNAGVDGLRVASGTWHQRLTDIAWQDPAGPSPVYATLKAQVTDGLDVKCMVDMYQTKRANVYQAGDRFGYGRLMASIGPATAEEPNQVVPGRRLYSPVNFRSPEATAEAPELESTRVAGEAMVARQAQAQPSLPPWSGTDCRIQTLEERNKTLLLVDLSGTTPLRQDLQGRFDLGGEVLFGHKLEDGQFVPFKMQGYQDAAGQLITTNEQLQLFTSELSEAKAKRNSVWLINSGVVQLELDSNEASAIANGVVAVHVRPQGASGVGEEQLHENANGYYINVDTAAERMEPNAEASVKLTVYQFGQPQSTHPAIELKAREGQNQEINSAVTLKLADGASPYPGRFSLQLHTGDAIPLPSMPSLRVPMDSLLYAIQATSGNTVIGEGVLNYGPPLPLLSLLFWQNHKVVQNADWDQIGPILDNYGRLYPGMKGLLDITDKDTVIAFARGLRDRFLADVQDPAFMPVVRDMSPSTIKMIVDWLDGQIQANV